MAWMDQKQRVIDVLLNMEIGMALDTAKLLAAVERERTENDSLRALVGANTSAFQSVSTQLASANSSIADLQTKLAAAVASGDPTAISALQAQVTDLQSQLTQAQADVDKATSDLSADADTSAAAIAANTPAAATPTPDPAATSTANP